MKHDPWWDLTLHYVRRGVLRFLVMHSSFGFFFSFFVLARKILDERLLFFLLMHLDFSFKQKNASSLLWLACIFGRNSETNQIIFCIEGYLFKIKPGTLSTHWGALRSDFRIFLTMCLQLKRVCRKLWTEILWWRGERRR